MDLADLFVTGKDFNLWLFITERTGRILSHRKGPKFCLQGMVDEKLTDQGSPLP